MERDERESNVKPMITYELAKEIHTDRLREAEQARLINSLKTEPMTAKLKRWLWRFNLKGSFTGLVAKIVRPGRLRSSPNR